MRDHAQESMQARIETFNRQALVDDAFADQLGDMALLTRGCLDGEALSRAMTTMARQLRVSAIRCRAHAVGVIAEYEGLYGDRPVEKEPD